MKRALIEWDIGIDPRNVDLLLDSLDTQKLGLVDRYELFTLLREPLSSTRQEIIHHLFTDLFTAYGDGKGAILVEKLRKVFTGEAHPLITLGGYTVDYTFDHLLTCLEIQRKKPVKINRAMLMDYYGDLSATIEDDEYFTHIVRSNWDA